MPAARFHVIIRRPNTTGPADILRSFFAKDKTEGRIRLQKELALMSHYPYRPEVQIFDDLHAA